MWFSCLVTVILWECTVENHQRWLVSLLCPSETLCLSITVINLLGFFKPLRGSSRGSHYTARPCSSSKPQACWLTFTFMSVVTNTWQLGGIHIIILCCRLHESAVAFLVIALGSCFLKPSQRFSVTFCQHYISNIDSCLGSFKWLNGLMTVFKGSLLVCDF